MWSSVETGDVDFDWHYMELQGAGWDLYRSERILPTLSAARDIGQCQHQRIIIRTITASMLERHIYFSSFIRKEK
jgi:hypothetical protein